MMWRSREQTTDPCNISTIWSGSTVTSRVGQETVVLNSLKIVISPNLKSEKCTSHIEWYSQSSSICGQSSVEFSRVGDCEDKDWEILNISVQQIQSQTFHLLNSVLNSNVGDKHKILHCCSVSLWQTLIFNHQINGALHDENNILMSIGTNSEYFSFSCFVFSRYQTIINCFADEINLNQKSLWM